ncbi:MAG TPA: HAMP domain-containing sensor histidine kinase [Afifellaceae bacterium]|nr:HAMP domain-containing sensor histidine kinase [Afifellaceae bacterium]
MRNPGRLRLFRTTAFRLSLIYLAVFTIFAAFLIGYIAKSTSQLLGAQVREAVDAEINGLAEQYRLGGIARLARIIENRSVRPGASMYLVTDRAGNKIAGNVEAVPSEILQRPEPDLQTVPYVRLDETSSTSEHRAVVRVFNLPGGFRVLVGRDLGEQQRFAQIIQQALILTVGLMVVLGLASWLFVSRRVLKRIDSVSETSRRIVDGDLSGRIEVTGTGDEFDRLAESLNAMLTRIERLMVGLKEVSDNIAHYLKTPLTRLRNRAERALAQGQGEPGYREALQAAIEAADQLIRTFDALLMIARAEAGAPATAFDPVDAAQVAQDVVELYEPLAEEAGVRLELKESGPAMITASRELLSQALVNLVDNAIKYAGSRPDARVVVAAAPQGRWVTLEVADNGPGIPEAERERVTERFVRLEESRSRPGAGLGLSLVSAVAHLHSGTLELSDNAPGLKAVLRLPAEPAAAHG